MVLVDEVVVEVVSGTLVVVVVDVVDVVVDVEFTMVVPKSLTERTQKVARVLYPDTVKWTPSAMKREAPRGTKVEFQSAIDRFGHVLWAVRSALANLVALKIQSRRPVAENFGLIHRTGRSPVCFITLVITHVGYQGSRLEIMSFTPSAMTTAVVRRPALFLRTATASDALRPTLASMITLVQMSVASIRSFKSPKAADPTVRLSPMKRRVP